ncbi:3'-5' exonuclease [Paenibacillus cineris]|uniref:3'-5' exonuclease n=1 Tax=Paenibacillus cineris TaxID=237530 RepID=UPI001B0829BC|nr:3'-5' exonuclease [Paenibacillus cineris]GIO63726.1 hypothetical protein J43TS9_53000 [Paenibacillus cineris]
MKFIHSSNEKYTISGISVKDMTKQRYCVFDFEATGPDPNEDCITQIGAVIVDSLKIREELTFCSLVRTPKPIPEKIERLTGISNQDVAEAPKLVDVYPLFFDFIGNGILVTQAGYEYDWPLLENECMRHGIPVMSNQILDLKVLFTYLHPEISEIVSTNYLINYYRIQDQDLKRHDALGDSKLIARILICILQEYKSREITDLVINTPIDIRKVKLPPLK